MTATADVVIAGTGIIGLCCATAVAAAGKTVILVGEHRKGEASVAAAGMLAPSVEKAEGPAHDFAVAARDLYPEFLEQLAERVGIRVPLNRLGVLQVALTERGVRGLRKTASPQSQWIDRAELSHLEPTIGHAIGAVMNPDDGSVDNVILMAALNELANKSSQISRTSGVVASVSPNQHGANVLLADGSNIDAGSVVLAPGAWAGSIDGALPLRYVTPLKGQLVAFRGIGLRHVTYGPRGYLVPRIGLTIAGSTMENAGFDATSTAEGVAKVQSAAREIAPALGASAPTSAWAGLRPVTPDMLPLLGPDATNPQIIYACGHSRNGILLAPLTGKTVASLVTGGNIDQDLSQFRPDRF